MKSIKVCLKNVNIFLKTAPRPEKCFSIIGEMTVNGEKSINIECETAEEASKWIDSLEMVANFIKNKYLKTFQKN